MPTTFWSVDSLTPELPLICVVLSVSVCVCLCVCCVCKAAFIEIQNKYTTTTTNASRQARCVVFFSFIFFFFLANIFFAISCCWQYWLDCDSLSCENAKYAGNTHTDTHIHTHIHADTGKTNVLIAFWLNCVEIYLHRNEKFIWLLISDSRNREGESDSGGGEGLAKRGHHCNRFSSCFTVSLSLSACVFILQPLYDW